MGISKLIVVYLYMSKGLNKLTRTTLIFNTHNSLILSTNILWSTLRDKKIELEACYLK